MPPVGAHPEEPDLEALFVTRSPRFLARSMTKISMPDYGFQSEWDDDEIDPEQLELQGDPILFNSIDEYPGHGRKH